MAGGVFCGYNAVSATKEIAIVRPKHVLFARLGPGPTAGLMGLFLAACSAPPPEPPPLQPREVVELERWTVKADGAELGELVKFEIRDPSGPVVLYRVLDRSGRWVGHADANGRFSRRVPFQKDERDVGTWTLARGCAVLFECDEPVELEAVPVEAVLQKGR